MTNEEVAVKLEAHEHEIGSLKHRMKDAEAVIGEVHNLAISMQLLAQESKNTGKKVDNLTEKVEGLEARPMETWSKVRVAAISAVATAIVSAVMAAIINII